MSLFLANSGLIMPATAGGFDPDAQAFFDAAVITDATQKDAVNQLVLDLKAASIWTKMSAIYPFVGGTATKHKFNLKDPRDLDAAFRIVWSGTITHDANGITGDGTTGFGNTKFVPSTNATLDDSHLSIYCRTVGINEARTEMGGLNSDASQAFGLDVRATNVFNGLFYKNVSPDIITVSNTTSAQGFWVVSRRASNDGEGYKNGTSIVTNSATRTGTRPAFAVYICAANLGGTTIQRSNRNYAFASIGLGLTDTEVSAFNTAVQAFQTTLGRQV